jgi:hypothetical protein
MVPCVIVEVAYHLRKSGCVIPNGHSLLQALDFLDQNSVLVVDHTHVDGGRGRAR